MNLWDNLEENIKPPVQHDDVIVQGKTVSGGDKGGGRSDWRREVYTQNVFLRLESLNSNS